MQLLKVFLFYFISSVFQPLYATDSEQPAKSILSDSFYTWLAKSHTMSSNTLANVNLAAIDGAYVSMDRIVNSTPLIKFYADRLQREGVPTDFAILPIIESGNNPQARSPMNALGLWQFIPSTGYEWGLGKNQVHDERTDVNKSTMAAAKYLRYLYDRYRDWNLVLAAYNWGPESVDRALKKGLKQPNGQINLQYLPKETRNYLIYFYSFNRKIETNYQNKLMSKYPNAPYLIEINSRDFNQYLNSSKPIQGMSRSVFSQVNGFSPDLMGTMKGVILVPTDLFSQYFSVEKISFHNKSGYRSPSALDMCAGAYETKYGDTLESIAAKYRLRVDALTDLNPSVRFVRPGMRIHLCESRVSPSSTPSSTLP